MARRTSSVVSAGAGRTDRLAGARQQVAAAVDDGDVLRPQPGHGGGDQVEDRLHALRGPAGRRRPWSAARRPGRPVCSRAKGSRCGSTRCTRTARTPWMARMVRASSPSSARVSLICCWNSVAAKAVAAIEDFVADRAAGGQPLLGQHQARFRRPGRPAPGSGCRRRATR